jgi:hypothetical protein
MNRLILCCVVYATRLRIQKTKAWTFQSNEMRDNILVSPADRNHGLGIVNTRRTLYDIHPGSTGFLGVILHLQSLSLLPLFHIHFIYMLPSMAYRSDDLV